MSDSTVNDNSRSTGPVPLTPDMARERDELTAGIADLMHRFTKKGEDVRQDLKALGHKAHLLHAKLVLQGNPPRFGKYMLQNRELEPSDPEFYVHVHPIQDLLRFIAEQSANDDPIDVTVGVTFALRFYCRRWSHDETITMVRTADGWSVSYVSGPIETGRDGLVEGDEASGLYHLLDHESVSYPRDLSSWIDRVWQEADDGGLNADTLQEALDRVGGWISTCERAAPNDGVFSSMKAGS